MRTSVQCLAEADRLAALALVGADLDTGSAFAETAEMWRRVAILARQQEACTKSQTRPAS